MTFATTAIDAYPVPQEHLPDGMRPTPLCRLVPRSRRRVAMVRLERTGLQPELDFTAPKCDDDFTRFHSEHPEVYAALVRYAREARAAGVVRLGIRLLWERMRWWLHVERTGADDWKLNNNLTARYARLIMEQEPDLAGFFETRERKS